MAAKRRRVDNGPIIPPAAAATLEQLCPDLANWPKAWAYEPGDIAIGQRIVEFIEPFLIDLLQQGLAHKTLTRHRDHLWMLGGEVIRRRHGDPDLAKQPVHDLLRDLIKEDGGPLIWPRIAESEQNAFDATCRKLDRFLKQQKSCN
jgi:hypothetical protein